MLRLREWLNRDERPNRFTLGMGKLIREAREQRGMSQEELARVINRSRPSISEMENGKMEPDASTLLLLAANLAKPIIYFYPPPYNTRFSPEASNPEEQELLSEFRQLDKQYQRIAINQVQALAAANLKEFTEDNDLT